MIFWDNGRRLPWVGHSEGCLSNCSEDSCSGTVALRRSLWNGCSRTVVLGSYMEDTYIWVHSVEYTRWSTLNGVHSVEYTRWSTLGGVHSVEYTRWSTLSKVHSVEYTRCSFSISIYISPYIAYEAKTCKYMIPNCTLTQLTICKVAGAGCYVLI